MSSQAHVAGVGMIPFTKPGANEPYHVMGSEALRRALSDAGIDYAAVQQAYVGYVYGDSTCGQRALYPVGMTGIPIVNVNNNCSTGSTALFLARQAIESGAADCVLALGFEQMKPGALGSVYTDRPSAFEDFDGWVRHDGEEFLYVLTGQIRLLTEFYAPIDMKRGDSAYYDASMGHNVISLSPEDATILWVTSLD